MARFLILILLVMETLIAHSQKIEKIKVVSAPLSATSTFNISCEEFHQNFSQIKKTINIENKNCISRIGELLNRSKPIKLNKIDTRGALVIDMEDKKVKKICFDEFGNFFDGNIYFQNELLFQFLLKHKLIEF